MEHFTGAQPIANTAAGTRGSAGPLVIVTTLFFMWGLLTSLNDVLIPHLKSVYTLSYVQAMLVQFCFFGAYFIASLPAGVLVKRIGYQNGVVAGLAMAALGCALFYPAAHAGYGVFLLAFFTLACGITILQVAANPFVTALGDPRTASSRLTLTQAFNSLGTAIAPVLGGLLILGSGVLEPAAVTNLSLPEQAAYRAQQAASVQMPYLLLAGALLLIAIVFACVRLPKLDTGARSAGDVEPPMSLLSHWHLVLGTGAIFAYVGAEVSIGSFLINFIGDPGVTALSPASAAHYVSYYWGGAMLGRFAGVIVMRVVSPGKALAFNAGCAILLVLFAVSAHGAPAMWSMIAVGLCNSIMFPAIFSMALRGLGVQTGRGSGLLCMAIVGGAIVPFAQGLLADAMGVQPSFVIPALCYAYVLYFGLRSVRHLNRSAA